MRYAAVVILIIVVIAAGVFAARLIENAAAPEAVTQANQIQIQMTSDPFPSAVGNGIYYITLSDGDGTPIPDAKVQFDADMMMMAGMLPLHGRAEKSADGRYPVDITWSMAGEWSVEVTATLPDQRIAKEQFNLYVYPVPPLRVGGEKVYQSVSAINAKLSADPAHEYWIVIPQGTQALQRSGQGEDLVPEQIHLSLTGQNVLVIRNDDIADQSIGPFFVRAGETVRQVFTHPAEYQGKCTVRHGAEVSIIVD